jgi:hypothetical protein
LLPGQLNSKQEDYLKDIAEQILSPMRAAGELLKRGIDPSKR